ncbi:MAG: hypothetical protein DYG83_18135 [Candidatus Brocadia sp. AMX2]|uniref:Uncharacterized protein n=1 Tax=Candidatus Brocadia sinica JPN1 TaxID=1197129 RepID=A0ABQ0JT37_9BACT|nr:MULTISPECIES: hypothetical protein [Brocadia]KXK30058.1 MAG: hypothetical protein UZ01_01531 [Candidatus Brocadia sinica]MBC6934140.1 hypothetical protein [Candidatus Brocadia sp.]MBL1170748.1 hypothetical protein [Candidatus Brocadia sp. AMX1]NOG43465.1 hypothetical protein [Planctomycetota bacterium]KAA0241151.1 MAG: hypothetical protein EDM70_18640 [Candidatus Brocadia sp. AMX2]
MRYEVTTPFTVKTKQGDLNLHPGQVITIAEEKALKLIMEGKIKTIGEPIGEISAEKESLNERMCIMGENCEPGQTEPYVTDSGVLVIPFNSHRKYHYWNGGQSVCDTLKEIGRCDLIDKYKSFYSN